MRGRIRAFCFKILVGQLMMAIVQRNWTSVTPLTLPPGNSLRKEKQDALLRQKNEETLRRLTAGNGGDGAAGGASTSGRPVSEIMAYRNVADIPATKDLIIQVGSSQGGGIPL